MEGRELEGRNELGTETCALCGTDRSVLSDEHIPPKSTGNRGRHRVEILRFGSTGASEVVSSDGVALRVLCKDCNSRFGSRLGTSFAEFAQQVQKSGRFVSRRGGSYVATMDVHPGRIARQLYLNFLCLTKSRDATHWDGLRDYVRSREGSQPSTAPRIGLYYNVSNTYRVVPVGALGALGTGKGPWTGAEVTAPGLGVVFTLGGWDGVHPAIVPKLLDVTDWASRDFSERGSMVLEIPRQRVDAVYPLGFGRPREVERWRERHAIAWLASRIDADVAPEVAALLWRPVPRKNAGRGR